MEKNVIRVEASKFATIQMFDVSTASPDTTNLEMRSTFSLYKLLAHDTVHGLAAEHGSLHWRHRKMILDFGGVAGMALWAHR